MKQSKQLVWMITIGRGINIGGRVYIVHAETAPDALRIISKDITYETILKLPGEIKTHFRILGQPITGSEWGDKYILI